MKIHLLSDIHLEFTPYEGALPDVDVIVLAGDVHTKTRAISWIKERFKGIPVAYSGDGDQSFRFHRDH